MLLSYKVKLNPDADQAESLRRTMVRFNTACNHIAPVLFEVGAYSRGRAHRLVYREIREKFGLSAQLTTRAINKVCACLRARMGSHMFRPMGAIDYDDRCLTIRDDHISILTLDGRAHVSTISNPLVEKGVSHSAYAKLAHRKGEFFLILAYDLDEPPIIKTYGILGVDLGQKSLAVDSDGMAFDGGIVERIRTTTSSLRDGLQSCGTKSAKRHLRELSGYERRFQADINHCISKSIVAKAKGTHRAIALEDLKGIRERTVVRKAQRRNHNSWAFRQLADFIEYKARLNGVPVIFVDPKYTSQTCPNCKHISRKNRISQSEFKCESCGFAGHADHVGAINIALRGYTRSPIVSGDFASHVGQPQEQAIES